MRNRLLTIGCVLIVIVGLVFLTRFSLKAVNTAKYKIFSVESNGYFIPKMIGYLPKAYQERYSESVIDSSKAFKLFNLVDKRSPIYKNFIVLKRTKTGEELFLKAYPLQLLGLDEETIDRKGVKGLVSMLVDPVVFSEYANLKNLSRTDEMISKYLFLLSDLGEKDSYKVIKTDSDVAELIFRSSEPELKYNKEHLERGGYKIIDHEDINFSNADVVYCWFQTKGLVAFRFDFKNGLLDSVESDIIGFFGNESFTIP